MLDEQHRRAGFGHADGLTHSGFGVGDCAEAEVEGDAVEGGVLKFEVLRVHLVET